MSVKTWPTLRRLVPVLVLDELWRRWPKGQKTNDAPMADKKLLAEHRHRVDKKNRSMRVVMVTQDLDQLASWATLLVETTYRMVKKSKTMFRVDIYNGVAKGDSPPKSKLLRSTAGRFSLAVSPLLQVSYAVWKRAVWAMSRRPIPVARSCDPGASGELVGLIVVCLSVGVPGDRPVLPPPQPKQASAPTPATKVVEQAQPVAAPQGGAMQAVYGTSSNGPVPSAIWRIAGYVHAGLGRAEAWPSKDGYNAEPDRPISKTSRGAGVRRWRTRFWPIEKCRFFEQTPDLYCDIDGERVTFWTGRGAVSTVMDATSTASGGSQRSAASAATGAQVQTRIRFSRSLSSGEPA
ncbi:hypothetical protein [Pseudomonas aeruginosa]|uniref:hypothetical protein n=1 Tax=Pseudomonas aeruginosa TaxID=287 RepID=UPI0021B4980A|nr:hypothetical protein [Pseudomonas aeruginosa]MCT7418393.1 hypothetical protein [Pseudomonas aeruginosa]